ncbi:MAG: hypothetical protein AMXMBFR33_08650 [Candidatus Xenobia bacterium]
MDPRRHLDQLEKATAKLNTEVRFENFPGAREAAEKLKSVLASAPADDERLTEAMERARESLSRLESITPTAAGEARKVALKALFSILMAALLVSIYFLLPGFYRLYYVIVAVPTIFQIVKLHQRKHW